MFELFSCYVAGILLSHEEIITYFVDSKQLLREEIEYMGLVRLKDVRESRQKIIGILRKLVECGDIALQCTEAEKLLLQKKTIFKARTPEGSHILLSQ